MSSLLITLYVEGLLNCALTGSVNMSDQVLVLLLPLIQHIKHPYIQMWQLGMYM